MANGNGTQTTAADCGEPVAGTGASITVPTVTGPVSNQTPLLISTMGEDLAAGEAPETESVSVGWNCPWPLVLLILVLAFILTRKKGSS